HATAPAPTRRTALAWSAPPGHRPCHRAVTAVDGTPATTTPPDLASRSSRRGRGGPHPRTPGETESSATFEAGSVSVAACRRVEQARDESVHPVLDCGQVVRRGAASRLDLGECHREASVGTRQARGRDGLSLRERLLVAPQLCSRLLARCL